MKKMFITLVAVLISISVCGVAMASTSTWWNCEDGCYPATGYTYVPFTHLQIEIVTPGVTFATPGWTWKAPGTANSTSGGSNWTAVNNSTLAVADGNTDSIATIVEYNLTFNGDVAPDSATVICSAWKADKSFVGAIYYYGGGIYYGDDTDTSTWDLYTGSPLSYVDKSAVPELPSSIFLAACSIPVGFIFRRRK